ncbi:rho GTPase-activating protein 19 isoform X3 [Panulirus ornatus]|uniref:rho GTPase-activating protein 19 isoform X3 n=1 Tax=Panulirus ornatus TaxID=150431 RepID=UPI003A89B30C
MNMAQQSSEDGESSIQKQLWYLRHEDPTQYHTLIKMHLSFTTDLPTDQCDTQSAEQTSGRRWQLTPLIRRLGLTSSVNKGVMEGAPLTQEGVCQVFQLIHYLNKDYNITQEGLFRKSGSLSRQQELKALLNSGADLNLDYGTYSAHDCASVLKSFLADLPEPLLTEGHYSIHCRIAEMIQSNLSHDEKEVTHARQIKALRLLFLLLPPENYQLLHDVLILLHRVAAHQKLNLMSAVNLGTMFAPHILCPRKMTPNDLQYQSGTLSIAVAFMIEHALQLFKVPLELEYDVRQYWSNKKKMRHQLSKRSMMDAPAKTIFTFIDRELTAQANDKDVTEVALAELYAYVQSLPDSAKKRRLIKQFNHASASGTPQLNRSIIKKQEARGKKLGDSIKKHLFHKTVKSSKSKSQPFSSIGYTKVKHNNSEDLLCKVIMTPRSRCPIIINSSTSLSSVAIPEEKKSHSPICQDERRGKTNRLSESMHTSPVFTNPAAQLTSPVRPVQPLTDSTNLISTDSIKKIVGDDLKSEKEHQRASYDCKKIDRETKLSRWSSSSLRRTLSSVSSNSSLFGSFFHHLSTSSLAQLATRLTSSSSVKDPEIVEEKESQDNFLGEDDGEMNESLSSVFKDYLLSRSILTDNPVDLSTCCLDNEETEEGAKSEKDNSSSDDESSDEHEEVHDDLGDSAYGGSQPLSKCTSAHCSVASLRSLDSALDIYANREFSTSLLYCLDGNDPLSSSNSSVEGDCYKDKTEMKRLDSTHSHSSPLQKQDEVGEKMLGLHSCSPDSRCQSLLKTKQGTPVPQREKKHSDSANSGRGVIFETSF